MRLGTYTSFFIYILLFSSFYILLIFRLMNQSWFWSNHINLYGILIYLGGNRISFQIFFCWACWAGIIWNIFTHTNWMLYKIVSFFSLLRVWRITCFFIFLFSRFLRFFNFLSAPRTGYRDISILFSMTSSTNCWYFSTFPIAHVIINFNNTLLFLYLTNFLFPVEFEISRELRK